LLSAAKNGFIKINYNYNIGVLKLMKNKIIIHFVCIMSFALLLFAGDVAHAGAWKVKIIDNETHRNNSNLAEGSYIDIGDSWRTSDRPYMINGQSRYLSQWEGRMQRKGTAYWRVQIPRTGWYILESSYKQSVNRTRDANYAVYVNTAIDDIENYSATPVYTAIIDQYGDGVSTIKWADLKVHCLKQGEISVIALDGRDDNYSDSADAGRWTYMGEEYNSVRCGTKAPKIAPINSLLLK
jgi:hypothetical protein